MAGTYYAGLKVRKQDTVAAPSLIMRAATDGTEVQYWDWSSGSWRPGSAQTREDLYSDEAFPMTEAEVRTAIRRQTGQQAAG